MGNFLSDENNQVEYEQYPDELDDQLRRSHFNHNNYYNSDVSEIPKDLQLIDKDGNYRVYMNGEKNHHICGRNCKHHSQDERNYHTREFIFYGGAKKNSN